MADNKPERPVCKPEKPVWKNVPNPDIVQDAAADERRFVALMLKDKESLEDAMSAGITYEYFIHDEPSQIFRLITHNFANFNTLLSHDTYKSYVQKLVGPEEGKAKWMEDYYNISAQRVDKGDYQFLKGTIKDRHVHRQGFTLAEKWHQKFLEAKTNQGELVKEFQQDVSSISMGLDTSSIRVMRLDQALTDSYKEFEERRVNADKFIGIKTGFQTIDDNFNGFGAGHYIILLGVPNGGKTTLMLNLARNMAKADKSVAYVTVESDISAVTRRMYTIDANINMKRIIMGGSGEDGLNEEIMSRLRDARSDMMKRMAQNFHWVEIPYHYRWGLIETRLRAMLSDHPIDVLYVDYLNVIGRERQYIGRLDAELTDLSQRIQNFAKHHKVLTFVAQQMKTDKVRELGKKPGASQNFSPAVGDARGSGDIEADADDIFAVWIDQDTFNRMYVKNTKARYNASQGRYIFKYDRASGLIENMPDVGEFGAEATKLEDNKAYKEEMIAKVKMTTTSEAAVGTLWGDVGAPEP